jgi:hypothetical protein
MYMCTSSKQPTFSYISTNWPKLIWLVIILKNKDYGFPQTILNMNSGLYLIQLLLALRIRAPVHNMMWHCHLIYDTRIENCICAKHGSVSFSSYQSKFFYCGHGQSHGSKLVLFASCYNQYSVVCIWLEVNIFIEGKLILNNLMLSSNFMYVCCSGLYRWGTKYGCLMCFKSLQWWSGSSRLSGNWVVVMVTSVRCTMERLFDIS